jgi:hypothetical protein
MYFKIKIILKNNYYNNIKFTRDFRGEMSVLVENMFIDLLVYFFNYLVFLYKK